MDILGMECLSQGERYADHLTEQVGAVLCGFTLICHMAYFFLERRLPHEYRVVTGRQPLQATQASRKLRGRPAMRPFSGEHIRALTRSLWAIPAAFWLLAMTQVLQVGAVRAYNSNLAEVCQGRMRREHRH